MTFDALAIGGGPAGCAAAIRLAQLGLTAALAEAMPGECKVGESLPPAVKPLLDQLGASEACEGALPAYGNQSAWGSGQLRDTDFIGDPNGPGFHVDRACFEARLRMAAARHGAVLLAPARVASIDRRGGAWAVSLRSGQTVSTRWILDCTGRNAAFAQSQKARRIHSDRLIAIAAIFDRPQENAPPDRDSRTLVESAEAGWWYTALMPGARRVAVFHTDPATPAYRMARTPGGFLELLGATRHVWPRIADHRYQAASPLRIFPANSSRLDQVIGDGWIAAGDAAAAFDPLSSQGIYTALYGGLQAAEAVRAALDRAPGAADRYRRIVRQVFDAYLDTRSRYYAMERRWVESCFWISHSNSPASAV
jgi:flavin-dependent dehydrogenase